MKRTLTMLALMLPMMAFAQWRVGVNCGADMTWDSTTSPTGSEYA